MPKSYNQKMKLLYLMELLQEDTDEEHSLSMKSILEHLEERGIGAARKSVYDDIDTLRQFGMDIEYRKEQPEGYYLASHRFELPELKLLVDAVQSSRFLTEKKSRSLIKKIEGLSSVYEAACLQRQVYVSDRIKTMNESIYYNVDKLHTAISHNVKIRFQYYRWTIEKKTSLRREGKFYYLSPTALCWAEENYYLIGYDEEAGMRKHFRVDKMVKIELLEEKQTVPLAERDFDVAEYSGKTFGMFGGEEQMVTIRFPDRYIGVVIDRFGKDVSVQKDGEAYFKVRVRVVVSEPFFGWLTGLGKDVTMIAPKEVVREYEELLRDIAESYGIKNKAKEK